MVIINMTTKHNKNSASIFRKTEKRFALDLIILKIGSENDDKSVRSVDAVENLRERLNLYFFFFKEPSEHFST